ncbi:hypothetical protein HMPREF9069_00164 [Atopobium sp. oral taxon 810 str. F0209]|nr:hypothetical protein HMPREF9069_00164 [Atopobium sp. oral taxon 810 str. F0209]
MQNLKFYVVLAMLCYAIEPQLGYSCQNGSYSDCGSICEGTK